MKTVFSAIQPSGKIHLGNYLGAIRHWKRLQETHNCTFMVANLHAMTTDLYPDAFTTFRQLKEIGVNNIYLQSSRSKEHLELFWELACQTPVSWLNRMTQFKEKRRGNLGLYSYPVLMAADILLHEPDYVPVGEDQKQHLELARKLAKLMTCTGSQSINLEKVEL